MADPTQEALAHVDETSHRVEFNEDAELWACLDCSWVESRFVPLSTASTTLDTTTDEFRAYLDGASPQIRLDLEGRLVCVLDGRPGEGNDDLGYTVYWTDGLVSDFAEWHEALSDALHKAAIVVAEQE